MTWFEERRLKIIHELCFDTRRCFPTPPITRPNKKKLLPIRAPMTNTINAASMLLIVEKTSFFSFFSLISTSLWWCWCLRPASHHTSSITLLVGKWKFVGYAIESMTKKVFFLRILILVKIFFYFPSRVLIAMLYRLLEQLFFRLLVHYFSFKNRNLLLGIVHGWKKRERKMRKRWPSSWLCVG